MSFLMKYSAFLFQVSRRPLYLRRPKVMLPSWGGSAARNRFKLAAWALFEDSTPAAFRLSRKAMEGTEKTMPRSTTPTTKETERLPKTGPLIYGSSHIALPTCQSTAPGMLLARRSLRESLERLLGLKTSVYQPERLWATAGP